MVSEHGLVPDEGDHRAAAALAGLDLELALGGEPHDVGLEKAVYGDASLELGIRGCIGWRRTLRGDQTACSA